MTNDLKDPVKMEEYRQLCDKRSKAAFVVCRITGHDVSTWPSSVRDYTLYACGTCGDNGGWRK